MDVHNNLGACFLEIVYKDALEYEIKLQQSIINQYIIEIKLSSTNALINLCLI